MNSYDVVRQIGEGAFGKAFLVRDRGQTSASMCVIKEINLSKMSLREREASKKEGMLLSKMKHPNIVAFFKSFQESNSLYIVMEFCDGGDLMKRISVQRGVPFTEEQVVNWFLQVCLGLKHIHDHKVLHRDIKAQAKLGDFGIARVLNNNLRQLVGKICRGRFEPVSSRYSHDLRLLLSQLFKVSPRDRPSVSSVLKRPFLEKLICKYLEPQKPARASAPVRPVPRPKPGPTVKKLPPKPDWKGPARGYTPTSHHKVRPAAIQGRPDHLAGPELGEVRGQQNHREHYHHYHHQLDALKRRNREEPPPHLHRNPPPHPPLHHLAERGEDRPVPYQMVAEAHRAYLQRRQEAQRYKLRAEKQLGLRPSTADAERYRKLVVQPQEAEIPQHTHQHRTQQPEDLLNQCLSFQAGEELKLSDWWVGEGGQGQARRVWSERVPETLLAALAGMEVSLSEEQRGDDGQGEEKREEEQEAEEEVQIEEESDVEVDGDRLEPRSDDDDTNFEESEDELREEVADSMKNLFIMDDDDEEPGEREEMSGRKEEKEGGEENGAGDPRPTKAESDSYPSSKVPSCTIKAQDEGCGGQPKRVGELQASTEVDGQ
ncbi:hypothetical protein NHX12_007039 [Muraenolepis orangiensis]|uniref:non-specific serine/threonine protein kinase n=1 Tax=Muraenolepis orangiensis TaxID=630683 RepID=A0A9Q0IAQ6_9TELE|nr:hypothetical protein NHX12_007039 [Muraenolepis orangiensis]